MNIRVLILQMQVWQVSKTKFNTRASQVWQVWRNLVFAHLDSLASLGLFW
jgi:hypothetical protein